MAQVPLTLAMLVVVAAGWWSGVVVADFASDRAECGDKLVALATCLPYAEGSAKFPTPDCCSGLRGVVGNSPKCLCILIKDRNDPQLGFKIDVNRGLSLPSICSASIKTSDCPKYMNISPNSPEAQVFNVTGSPPSQDGSSSVKGNSTGSGKTDGTGKINGGSSGHYWKGERWLGVLFSGLVVILIMYSS